MTVYPIIQTLAAAAPDVRRVLATERNGRTEHETTTNDVVGRSDTTGQSPAGDVAQNPAGDVGQNPSGDDQIAADAAVDQLLERRLATLDMVGSYASEERADIVDYGDGYAVTVDPVDGSSNLRSNNPVGTVVGVYDEPLPAGGTSLVASIVLVYGAVTTMVVARDGETRLHIVDESSLGAGELLTLPDPPSVFGVDGSGDEWPAAARAIPRTHDLRLRYTGAMVADLMHVLDQGGLAWYPALESRPNGVLRLQYESNPVAHIIECADGRASDGTGRLRERDPEALHERVPTAFGNTELVETVERS